MKMKPLGSEKLTGQDKIQRMIEIANYKAKDTTINESSTEYSKYAVDGNTYAIVKENDGYYVKVGLNESTLEYVDGILNKSKNKFSSYSGALRKINLMIKPLNEQFNGGKEDPVLNETKYVLRKSAAPSEEPIMDEPVMDEPTMDEPSIDSPEEDLDLGGLNLGAESDSDLDVDDDSELDLDLGIDDVEKPEEDEEGGDKLKKVQKLTGKLGQALRTMKIDLESSDIKYVLNSIISAVDLTKLSGEDLEDVMTNFEELDEFEIDGEESVGDDEDFDLGLEDEELDGEELDLGGEELELEDDLSETTEIEEKDINEWGSSDQGYFNKYIHDELGEPETMPSPFSSDFESAAESAVDHYWDDWEEYGTDRHGLIEDAKRGYLRSYFRETFDMLVKMFEPAIEGEEESLESDLDEGMFVDGLKTLGGKFLQYYKENPEARKMVNDLGSKAISKGTNKIASKLDKSDTMDKEGSFSGKLKGVNPTSDEINKLGNMIFGDLNESEVSEKIDNVLSKYFK